MPQRSRR